MIRKDIKKRGGIMKTHVRVIEGYRPGPGMPTKQRTIKSFGYLEDQEDPEVFMAMVEQYDASLRKELPLRIEAASNALMYSEGNRRQNYGYKYLEAIYDLLKVDSFIQGYEKLHRFRGKYPAQDIFKFLVLARILQPDSKRASFQMKESFYEMRTEFTLPDIYRSLDLFADFEVELQRHLNERVKETVGRD